MKPSLTCCRFYVIDPKTGEELVSHPLNGARNAGTGAWCQDSKGRREVGGMRIRKEVYIQTSRYEVSQPAKTDKTVIVKSWNPVSGEAERFWLIPA